jgi:hypothetical protein
MPRQGADSPARIGNVRVVDDRSRTTWCFERVLEKYGQQKWTFKPGYPHLDRTVVYEQRIEILSGKRSEGLHH